MRPFDLHHHDTDENAGWNDVQTLMDRIQSGMEGRPHFELWESNDGNLIIEVGLATMQIPRLGSSAEGEMVREAFLRND